jgi:malate dehydrogenase
MSAVAIVGAGAIGAAVAQHLALHGRAGTAIRLIDLKRNIAVGKALDIQQATPIEGIDVSITGDSDTFAAAGADVIIVADDATHGEWTGDEARQMLAPLARAGRSTFVFAGPQQSALMEACHRELDLPASRLLGTAAAAMIGAASAFAALELNASRPDITVVGRPPDFVVLWSSASVAGSLLTDRLPAHRLASIGQSLTRFWPPGPFAIASATVPVIESLVRNGRQPVHAVTVLEGELGVRGTAALLPVAVGHGRVLHRMVPSLSPQEHTALMNSLGLTV